MASWVSMGFENTSTAIAAILLVGCLTALIENVVRTARNTNRSP
jgi:hypothetical protein